MLTKKRSFYGIFLWILGLIFLAGCVSTVLIPVQARREATFNVAGIQRVAVLDFTDYPGTKSGEKVANIFVSQLLENKHYQVMERSQMAKIMQEHTLSLSGVVDAATARQVGKALGVEAIIFGSVSAYTTETTRGTEQVTKQEGTGKYEEVERTNIFTGKKYKVKEEIMRTAIVPREYIVKKGTVGLDFRMVNVETGEVIGAKSETASYNQKAVSSSEMVRLPSDEAVLADLTKEVAGKLINEISPHYVTYNRVLELGKDELTKMGTNYAKNGLWDEAVEQWKNALSVNPANKSAHNNLAVYYEKNGQYKLALDEYKKALGLEPNNQRYMKCIAEMKEEVGKGK